MKVRAVLSAIALAAFAGRGTSGAEPNNTLEKVTVVQKGTMVISDDLYAGVSASPDTYLGIRNISNPIQISLTDDNGSTFGGTASGLQRVPLANQTALAFSVTGKGDSSFKGAHTQSGLYDVNVSVLNAAGEQIKTFQETRTLQPGVADNYSFSGDASWIGGFFNVNIKNYKPIGGDVDFFWFKDLKPGQFTAQVFAPGTLTSLFVLNSAGTVLRNVNNGGEGPFGNIPQVVDTVPSNRELIFAVTGSGDRQGELPVGAHERSGSYQLRVFQPGPSANFNNDNIVGGPDLAAWKDGYRQKTLAGDADRDFDTDGADFLLWQRQVGSPAALGAVSVVPEPAGSLVLAAGSLLLAVCRRRR